MDSSVYGNIEQDFIGCIPELPPVMKKLIELTRTLNVSRNSYANILLADSVLSSRVFSYINLVLNSSNSAYISINKGVSIMGLHKFKNVALVFSLFPVFQEAECEKLFKYSLLTAYYSKEIASRFNFINRHDAFLMGFLHDIGKIAMRNRFGEKYETASHDKGGSIKTYTAEEELREFNCCHTDLSEYICRLWNLPIVITDSIKFHHLPLKAMLPQAASIIYLADMLANKNNKVTKENQQIFQYMRLSKSELMSYSNNCNKKILPFLEILGAY